MGLPIAYACFSCNLQKISLIIMFQDVAVGFVSIIVFIIFIVCMVACFITDAPPGYIYKVANDSSLDRKRIIPVSTISKSEEESCEEIIIEDIPESNPVTEEGCTASLNDVYIIDGQPFRVIDILNNCKFLELERLRDIVNTVETNAQRSEFSTGVEIKKRWLEKVMDMVKEWKRKRTGSKGRKVHSNHAGKLRNSCIRCFRHRG